MLFSIKRIEGFLEGMRDVPVQRLKDDIKELQVCVYRLDCVVLLLRTRFCRNGKLGSKVCF